MAIFGMTCCGTAKEEDSIVNDQPVVTDGAYGDCIIIGFSGVDGGVGMTIGAGAGVGAKAEAGTGVAPETPKSILLSEVSSGLLVDTTDGLLPEPNPIDARVF